MTDRNRSENLKGIACMMGAMAVLSIMDAVMKDLGGRYAPLQVGSLRGLMSLPFILLWVWARNRSFATLVRVRWGFQFLRGAMAVVMLAALVYGLSALPLSEAYTLFFIAPLVITALSVPLLGEIIDGRRWMAVVVGFLGVLVVLRPGLSEVSPGSLAILLASFFYSLNAIAVRILGRTDSTAGMTFWFTSILGVGSGILAIPAWTPILADDWPLLVLLGVTGSTGQYLLTESFRRAPVSVVAPFEYSALFWAVTFDLLIFEGLPEPIVFAGAALIVLSGLYLLNRERLPQAREAVSVKFLK